MLLAALLVETMIVLAISMTIGVTALIMLSQSITQDNFSSATNNFSQKIQQAMVDTTSGYNNYSDNLTYTANPLTGAISIAASGTHSQGSNFGCR